MIRIRSLLVFVLVIAAIAMAFQKPVTADALTGAWQLQKGSEQQVLLIQDGYVTHTTFDKAGKRFLQTRGGTLALASGKLEVAYEFDTKDKEKVGTKTAYSYSLQGGSLATSISGADETWQRVDEGKDGLSGLWEITARKGDNGLTPIHRTGTRKTIKILSGTRFQWAAIDPGTKQFMGTGGGTYTFRDGKYTENIEFFSRDSSRVGSSLSFDGKLEAGDWHHSGLSSRGEPIYEVWSRGKKSQ
ncbi:MAG: membrane or secreted protein [Chitinophagaceae bacterium]|nr:MAG: membrane or secreted protein [Chitinophagaceae bacterium]